MATDIATSKVKLRLTTQEEGLSLPEDQPHILVDTNLRRTGLSTLVNHLLDNEKPVPFQFRINGTFLQTSIDEFLTANGISSETLLTVEYVRAILPPSFVTSYEHDDWVSSVDVLSKSSRAAQWGEGTPLPGQERILSGSYDGFVRVWNMSNEVVATSPGPEDGGHRSSVKSAKFVTPTQIASAGLDRVVRIWKYSEDQMKGSLKPQLELYGHKALINTIDIHAPSARVLSASDDHIVGLWSTKKNEAPAAPESLLPRSTGPGSKKRKTSTTTSVSVPQRGSLSLLKGHNGPVSSAMFAPNDPTVAYSASWDHTLRTWDLPTGSLVDTRTTSHPLFSVEALPHLNLIAVGTSARHITLIDPRTSATTVSAMTLRGHTNAVVSLSRNPDNKYGLLSGSHDGTCRVWDLRSTRSATEGVVSDPVYKIGRESVGGAARVAGDGVKVFGAVWDREVGIVSGGEDKRIQINKA